MTNKSNFKNKGFLDYARNNPTIRRGRQADPPPPLPPLNISGQARKGDKTGSRLSGRDDMSATPERRYISLGKNASSCSSLWRGVESDTTMSKIIATINDGMMMYSPNSPPGMSKLP